MTSVSRSDNALTSRASSAVLQTQLRELLAHLVHVEAELAGGEALALLFLIGDALLGSFGDFRSLGARHDANAVIIRDDHIARFDALTRADHRYIHRAETRLDRALREDGFAPHGEFHLRERR